MNVLSQGPHISSINTDLFAPSLFQGHILLEPPEIRQWFSNQTSNYPVIVVLDIYFFPVFSHLNEVSIKTALHITADG